MSTLTDARALLAETLGALTYVPEVIDPPCVVIEPGEPYLTYEGAKSFAWEEFIATLDVYVLLPADDNEAMARDLDARLLAAINSIEDAEWSVFQISKPDTFATADWSAYGVKITVRRRVQRG